MITPNDVAKKISPIGVCTCGHLQNMHLMVYPGRCVATERARGTSLLRKCECTKYKVSE